MNCQSMLCLTLMLKGRQFANLTIGVLSCILLDLSCLATARTQDTTQGNLGRPVQLEAADPEIRALSDKNPASFMCFDVAMVPCF